MRNSADIVEELAQLLANFQGREYSDPISRETLFFADLGFASIDAVVLGEELEQLFGQKISYNSFLAELAGRGAQDVAVGELADFLAGQLQ